jgi:outer membrane receptor protein involved in Fe transport
MVPNFSMAVDFYTILIRDEIGTLDPNQILSACYGGVPYVISQAQACGYIGPRNSLTGSLGNVTALNGNVSDENTDGIDLDMTYVMATEDVGLPAIGKLTLNGQVNYLLSDNAIGLGGFVQQQAGTYSGADESGEPRWKALVGATLSTDTWSTTLTERYYGGVRNIDPGSACEDGFVVCPTKGAYDYEGNEAAGIFYTDISGSYTYKNLTLIVGVDNLFDKDPPYLEPTAQVNFISTSGYDPTGRFVYMKATMKF